MPAPATQSPAWTSRELAADPHANAQKAEKVRRMFGAIAHRYDLNNRLHSFGRDQAWRRAAVRLADVKPSDRVLDVACGTGDLTRAFARSGASEVTGLDFTPEMLDIARAKSGCHGQRSESSSEVGRGARTGAPVLASSPKPGDGDTLRPINYIQGDAMDLPFEDASFDIVSIAFGIRNVTDPPRALREFRRVLRPGGRLIVLEFSRPRFAPIAWANDFYCSVIMPRTATFLAGDRSGAYHYLPRSVRTFMSREAMADAIADAGFTNLRLRPMTFGVCVAYRGEAR